MHKQVNCIKVESNFFYHRRTAHAQVLRTSFYAKWCLNLEGLKACSERLCLLRSPMPVAEARVGIPWLVNLRIQVSCENKPFHTLSINRQRVVGSRLLTKIPCIRLLVFYMIDVSGYMHVWVATRTHSKPRVWTRIYMWPCTRKPDIWSWNDWLSPTGQNGLILRILVFPEGMPEAF